MDTKPANERVVELHWREGYPGTMIKLLKASLSALLVGHIAVLLGLSNAWGNPGDEALAAFVSGNYPRAHQLAQDSAEAESFLAQFTLGRIYEEGKGAPQDKTVADKWFRQALSQAKPAAEKGDPRAQFVLGRMYDGGWVLPKDDSQAASWYRKAAEQGFALAQSNLAAMYVQGRGGAKNEAEAVVWYGKAAEQGLANAQFGLASLYANGQGVSQNHEKATSWLRKAAEQGFAAAQSDLGVMYALGRGVPQNYEKAISWYRKAAEQSNAPAQRNLGGMYERGQGVSQNYEEAVAWYRKAAEQGLASAQFDLGWMYLKSQGVPQNYEVAVSWWRKAAEQGNSDAQFNLGVMYERGRGVATNEVEAVDWYRKAAAQGNAGAQANLAALRPRVADTARQPVLGEPVSDGTSMVNGKAVKAKLFSFDAILSAYGQPNMPDPLVVQIDETGFVKIYSRMSQASHLFAAGEVETFIGLLKEAAKSAKLARFTKQAGTFRIGTVGGGDLNLTMNTSPGGSFPQFSLFMKNIEGGRVEVIINQKVIDGLIDVLSKSDQIVSQQSGETGNTKIIKLSMSRPGETGANGGLTLKVSDAPGVAALLVVEEVDFKLLIQKKDKAMARRDFAEALQYLRTANKTYEDMPDKKFKILGLGKPVVASVEAFDGNSDRYQFTAHITGDGEEKPRWVVIREDQLAKLIAILGR